jgi:polar amino acid transport system permease protein
MAEIMRSGIRAVGPGQRLAARALGLEESQVMRWVVLPQAFRIVIPPIGNQFIGMLKLSALVSVIGVKELLLTADETASSNFRYIETLTAAGIWYLVLTTIFMVIQSAIERRLRRRTSTRRVAIAIEPAIQTIR